MTSPVPRGEGNTEWVTMGNLETWMGRWMSCLCMCQETPWALEMTRDALQFTHTGLCSPVCHGMSGPVDAVDGQVCEAAAPDVLGRWAEAAATAHR
jgi:hypothetical protein